MNFNHDYHQVGLWSWNDELFVSKFIEGKPDECWTTNHFTQSPYGPLFGARLYNSQGKTHRQMIQARRVQAMRQWGDIVGQQVTHTCGCKTCLNPAHLELKPSRLKVHQG